MAASPLGAISSITFPNDFPCAAKELLASRVKLGICGRDNEVPQRVAETVSKSHGETGLQRGGVVWEDLGSPGMFYRDILRSESSQRYTSQWTGRKWPGGGNGRSSSAFLYVGEFPSFLLSGSTPGYPTHSVLYGIPLKFRVYLGRKVMGK
jgi:hypothetical protein